MAVAEKQKFIQKQEDTFVCVPTEAYPSNLSC